MVLQAQRRMRRMRMRRRMKKKKPTTRLLPRAGGEGLSLHHDQRPLTKLFWPAGPVIRDHRPYPVTMDPVPSPRLHRLLECQRELWRGPRIRD
jgi:hypothetical protein